MTNFISFNAGQSAQIITFSEFQRRRFERDAFREDSGFWCEDPAPAIPKFTRGDEVIITTFGGDRYTGIVTSVRDSLIYRGRKVYSVQCSDGIRRSIDEGDIRPQQQPESKGH